MEKYIRKSLLSIVNKHVSGSIPNPTESDKKKILKKFKDIPILFEKPAMNGWDGKPYVETSLTKRIDKLYARLIIYLSYQAETISFTYTPK